MSYTPTTRGVRQGYASGKVSRKEMMPMAAKAAFDRWLAALIREAKAEAWDEGHDAGWNSRDDDAARGWWVPSVVHESDAVNPYREGSET